jgi:hypothetical protein
MARMLGTCRRPWCPYCRSKGMGLDCPDASRSKRSARARERRAWRREAQLAAGSRHREACLGDERPTKLRRCAIWSGRV